MKSGFNAKIAVLSIGITLIMVGLASNVLQESNPTPTESKSTSETTLKVKRGNNLPTSTIDKLQGSGSLQTQGQAGPQSSNAGSSLQPNAGADSLPKSY